MANKVGKLLPAFCFGDIFPGLWWMDFLTGLIGRLKKVSKELDSFFDQIIDEHLIQNKHNDPDYNKDFVDLLLEVQNDNLHFTRDYMKAMILDLFVGGTDTTSTTIEWAMMELVKNPNVMKKAQEEVRKVVGKKNKVYDGDIHQMEYLKLVVKETLRLHPAVALNVLVSSTITNVQGYHVPAKTAVFINNWSIHRDPKLWDRPEEFIPERFSENPIDFQGKDFKYIPFGTGRRSCPGLLFAIVAVEFAIANLLYWFDWEIPCGEEIDITESFGLTVSKKIPLRLVPTSHFS
ncbi:Cytochrome p450 [Thalictrum thalictroides]|uniref:Cytochrome p450 n=1 Tax=Thalictrum thalictroides TaxID=46969 RepID=A0A7J6X3G8_THATH|nr:Cytochrome p450 [Thalictrum thalictroides]